MTNTVSQLISDETLNRIITIESGGNPIVKAKTSSATGLFQFLNSTWMVVVQRYRPEWLEGRTKAEVLALRKDPRYAIEMGARFTEENAKAIPGEHDADGDLYLAHFSGVGVARKLFSAPQRDRCENYYTADAVEANHSILAGKTVGEVRLWAENKMKKAGGRNWIAKYMRPGNPATVVAGPIARETPRDQNPEEEWTYPPSPAPTKSGETLTAQIGTSGGIAGTAYLVYEKITEIPESVWGIVAGLAEKPAFWFAIGAATLFAFIWWKRHHKKEEEEV